MQNRVRSPAVCPLSLCPCCCCCYYCCCCCYYPLDVLHNPSCCLTLPPSFSASQIEVESLLDVVHLLDQPGAIPTNPGPRLWLARSVSEGIPLLFSSLLTLPCFSASLLLAIPSVLLRLQTRGRLTYMRAYIHPQHTYIHTHIHTYTCARVRQLWKKSRISRKRSPLDLDITQESWTTPKARTPLPRTPKAERQGN